MQNKLNSLGNKKKKKKKANAVQMIPFRAASAISEDAQK